MPVCTTWRRSVLTLLHHTKFCCWSNMNNGLYVVCVSAFTKQCRPISHLHARILMFLLKYWKLQERKQRLGSVIHAWLPDLLFTYIYVCACVCVRVCVCVCVCARVCVCVLCSNVGLQTYRHMTCEIKIYIYVNEPNKLFLLNIFTSVKSAM